jgi:hypothetical protein
MIERGWQAAAAQYPLGQLLGYAIAADNARFDLLDVSDYFHPANDAQFESLAALGERNSNV